jgi:hypothetical protein
LFQAWRQVAELIKENFNDFPVEEAEVEAL